MMKTLPVSSRFVDVGRSRSKPVTRVVCLFDLDCFYAQVKMVNEPSIRDKPVGVVQKYLVVTSNYLARSLGVGKMEATVKAVRTCPNLILRSGEDLSEFRVASEAIFAVIRKFSPFVDRKGFDEFYVDITDSCHQYLEEENIVQQFVGHVLDPSLGGASGAYSSSLKSLAAHEEYAFGNRAVQRDEEYDRNHSLFHQPFGGREDSSDSASLAACLDEVEDGMGNESECDEQKHIRQLLMAGSRIAKEIRDAIFKELGYECCGGVSVNKMLSKIASDLHKPNKQTTLLPFGVESFLSSLPLRRLPG